MLGYGLKLKLEAAHATLPSGAWAAEKEMIRPAGGEEWQSG